MKYYGLTLKPLSKGDSVVMTNPAIDSFISLWVEPRRAVDDIVDCSSVEDLDVVVRNWLD